MSLGRNVTDLAIAYKWPIVLAAVVGGLWASQSGAVPQAPTIPQPALVGATAVLGTAALGYIPAARFVKWLYSPDYRYLIDLDAVDDEFAIYELTPQAWEDLEIVEGELHHLPNTLRPAYTCEGHDPQELTAEGTWRGSASDLEMLQQKERIAEVRGELEAMAQQGISIRMRVGSIVRSAVSEIVSDLVAQYEGITIPHGSRVETSVQDALDDYDLVVEEDEAAEDADEKPTVTVNVDRNGGAVAEGGPDGA